MKNLFILVFWLSCLNSFSGCSSKDDDYKPKAGSKVIDVVKNSVAVNRRRRPTNGVTKQRSGGSGTSGSGSAKKHQSLPFSIEDQYVTFLKDLRLQKTTDDTFSSFVKFLDELLVKITTHPEFIQETLKLQIWVTASKFNDQALFFHPIWKSPHLLLKIEDLEHFWNLIAEIYSEDVKKIAFAPEVAIIYRFGRLLSHLYQKYHVILPSSADIPFNLVGIFVLFSRAMDPFLEGCIWARFFKAMSNLQEDKESIVDIIRKMSAAPLLDSQNMRFVQASLNEDDRPIYLEIANQLVNKTEDQRSFQERMIILLTHYLYRVFPSSQKAQEHGNDYHIFYYYRLLELLDITPDIIISVLEASGLHVIFRTCVCPLTLRMILPDLKGRKRHNLNYSILLHRKMVSRILIGVISNEPRFESLPYDINRECFAQFPEVVNSNLVIRQATVNMVNLGDFSLTDLMFYIFRQVTIENPVPHAAQIIQYLKSIYRSFAKKFGIDFLLDDNKWGHHPGSPFIRSLSFRDSGITNWNTAAYTFLYFASFFSQDRIFCMILRNDFYSTWRMYLAETHESTSNHESYQKFTQLFSQAKIRTFLIHDQILESHIGIGLVLALAKKLHKFVEFLRTIGFVEEPKFVFLCNLAKIYCLRDQIQYYSDNFPEFLNVSAPNALSDIHDYASYLNLSEEVDLSVLVNDPIINSIALENEKFI